MAPAEHSDGLSVSKTLQPAGMSREVPCSRRRKPLTAEITVP